LLGLGEREAHVVLVGWTHARSAGGALRDATVNAFDVGAKLGADRDHGKFGFRY
jgi:hypothetical protein